MHALKQYLLAVAALGAIAAFPAAAHAAALDYPARPVRLLVPFAPGGGADTLARIIAPRLSEAMGQQWVVDNRAGAGGSIAAETLARASPDGHTVFMGFSTVLTVNPTLYKLAFDMAKDLYPVTLLATAQYLLVVHPSVPATGVAELVAYAKQKPGGLNYASAGVGSPLHLAGELLKARAGIDMVHVPYKGGGPAAAAVLAGEAQVIFGSVAARPSSRAARCTSGVQLHDIAVGERVLAPDVLPVVA
jgi:tripartite-type tricarboxylate transporter receptor subunit TctC